MERSRNVLWLVALVTAFLSLCLGIVGGALAGGLAGYFLGQGQAASPDVDGRLERMEGAIQEMERRMEEGMLPLQRWREMPENTLGCPPWCPEGLPPEVRPERPQVQVVTGALIVEVIEGTPAEGARLRVGDLIVAVGDEQVSPDQPLPDLVGRHRPGDQVTLTILRDGKRLTVEVRLVEHPEQPGHAYLGVRARLGDYPQPLVP